MKHAVPVLLVVFLASFVSAAHGQAPFDVPDRHPLERYKTLIDKSPFVQAALLEEPAPKKSFARDFALVSHYRLGEVLYVNLLSRKDQNRVVATSDGETESGMKVISLTEGKNPWDVRAVIEWRGERATVGFDAPSFPQPAGEKNVASAKTAKAASKPVRRTRVRKSDD